MTTTAFYDAARAYAATNYAVDWDTPAYYDAEDRQDAEHFMTGAEWARDHLARQEPTDAEVEAAAIMLCASAHHERVWGALAEVEPARQDRLRADARAALTAAKEAK